MLEKSWDFFVETLTAFFLPLVCSYFALSSNIFINTACEEATGLERIANTLLMPCHYLSGGQVASRENGEWKFKDRFEDRQLYSPKTAICSVLAAPAFVTGLSIKAVSLLASESRDLHKSMTEAFASSQIKSNHELYRKLNIAFEYSAESLVPLGLQRRPGDENALKIEKEALREIGALLDEAKIPWWIDCGTCLGAYRYGGVIPWDEDIDVAVLLPEFENIQKILSKLDPKKYIVQDWSCGSHPKSFMKVYIRESETLVDIYYYDIHPEKREISYVMSYEESIIFPEFVKIREGRFKVPASYDVVFPLQKASLDGVPVYVPRDIKKYLQRCYGENLDPAKIYDPKTNQYEKDLTHPYWQREYVH